MTEDTDTRQTARAFGRYRVLRVLGEGAMGTVYLAEDPVIGRRVAVKVLQSNKGGSASEQEEMQSRFEREFKAAGSLAHPHLVTIHDVGREQGTSFIAMEYVEGDSLRSVLNKGTRLPTIRVTTLLRQIAAALDFAHARGIIHRDVKPANILLTARGDAKITDFGVAKVSSVDLTRTGIILGTPAYMSPEQVTDQNLTPAADQFSLAVMAYQMLVGRRPFGGENATKTLYQIAYHEPTLASEVNRQLSAAVDEVLKKAMAKKPTDRYPSCRLFADALAEALGTDREAGVTSPQGHSSLATRRMVTVQSANPDLGQPEASLPTLELGEPAPCLMESAHEEPNDEANSGPPPTAHRVDSPVSQRAPRPLRLEPLAAPVRAPRSPEPPVMEGSTPRGTPPTRPFSELAALDSMGERRLEILPLAQDVEKTVDQIFGMATKDGHYRVWQGIGLAIALIVAVALWVLWTSAT